MARTVLAGSGILALGVSLSAQESLSNILGGLFITSFKPFEVGDRIKIISSDITGIVEDITFRHTVIRTFTNTRIIVPNATMNKEVIENSNWVDNRASSFLDIVISYESDMDRAREIIAELVGSHPNYIDVRTEEEKVAGVPKVNVMVRELSSTGVHLRASVWTSTVSINFNTCSDIRIAIKKRFDTEKIEIPYQRVTVNSPMELLSQSESEE